MPLRTLTMNMRLPECWGSSVACRHRGGRRGVSAAERGDGAAAKWRVEE
jgi:hypothetical protein